MKFKYSFFVIILLIASSCSIFKDKKVFKEQTYYKNGVLQSEVTTISGKLNGQARYYDNESNIVSIANYKNNILNGMWIEYYKNGKTKHSIKYNFGFKDGSELWYYDNGSIKSETVYDDGKVIFETLRWDTDGNILYK